MRFGEPTQLWWGILVVVLILGIALRARWRKQVAASLGDRRRLADLYVGLSLFRRRLKMTLIILGTILLILAFARPQAGEKIIDVPAVGLDVVVALDFSKSMLARDIYPNRLERAKIELNRLIDKLKGDRLGLVAFAGETITFPLTSDYAAAKLFWRDLVPQDMPVGGTAIGKAIVAATRLLTHVRGKGPARSQVIVLLTDGEDHETEPEEAAKAAAKLGIQIYAVGLGSRSGEPVPELNEDGTIAGYLEKDGKPVTTRVDEQTLKKVADITRGKYFLTEPERFAIDPLLDEISKLQRAQLQTRSVKQYDEIFWWFLLPAALCLLLDFGLSERRRVVERSVAA